MRKRDIGMDGGPTYGGRTGVLVKRAKVKKGKKLKKLVKLVTPDPFGKSPWQKSFDIDCGKAANAGYVARARDASLSRAERMDGLVKADHCSLESARMAGKGKKAKLNKRAKKAARERREHLEYLLEHGDVYERARALDVLAPVRG